MVTTMNIENTKTKYPTPRGAAATKAKSKYNAKAYDQFLIYVPKGYKDLISKAAEGAGFKSRNEFILAAIRDKMPDTSVK